MEAVLAVITGDDWHKLERPDTTHPRTEFTSVGKLSPNGILPGTLNKSKNISAPRIRSMRLVVWNEGSASCTPGGISQDEMSMDVDGKSTVTLGNTRNSTVEE